VDKPAGPTSHDVVARARRALGMRRIGHAGTLDPPASGLLVLLIGRATRLMQFVSLLDKRYIGTVRFGWETTTDDATGQPTARDDVGGRPSAATIRSALETVRAQPLQDPPPISAKKIEGERAYRRARRGEAVALQPAAIAIHRLTARDIAAPDDELPIEVECSSGTYVRAIARDIGRAAGTRAHLASLRRTGIGPWDVRDAVPFDTAFEAAAGTMIRPMEEAVAHLPRVELDDVSAQRFKFGQRLGAPPALEGPAAVFAAAGLIGVAEARDGLLKPTVGLAS